MTTGGRIAQATEPPADGTTIDVTQVRHELADALERLVEYEQALRAISQGEVDALVIGSTPGEEQTFTLSGADRAYRNFVENMSDGAATVSIDGIVLYANQALADLLGTSCEQIVGRPLAALLDGATREHLAQMVGPHSSGGSFEAALLGSDDRTVPVLIGSSLADERDSETLICITVTDLTRERQAEAAVTYSAQHDTLTGLTNRGLLNDRIEHALARRASDKNVMALLFCDLDGFKNINDAHGHQVGDETLRVVSQRLASAVRPEDTVARIGGDEFVVLCGGLEDMTDAAVVASGCGPRPPPHSPPAHSPSTRR